MFKTQIIAILIFHPGHTKKSIFYLMHNIETLIRAFHKFQELSQKVSRNWSKKLLKRCSKKSKVAFCNESCSKKTCDKFCPQFKPKMFSTFSWNCRFRASTVLLLLLRLPYKDLNNLLHLRHSNQSSVSHWPSSSAAPGEELAPFSQEINKLSANTLWNMKATPI